MCLIGWLCFGTMALPNRWPRWSTEADEVVKQYSTIIPTVNAAPQKGWNGVCKTTLTNVYFLLKTIVLITKAWSLYGRQWIIYCGLFLLWSWCLSSLRYPIQPTLRDGLDGWLRGLRQSLQRFWPSDMWSNTIIADYLNIFYIPDTAELVIFAACFLGGCIGFCGTNSYPRQSIYGWYQ